MIAVIHKISVGGGGKHTLSPEESLRRSVSLRACHYGGETMKQFENSNILELGYWAACGGRAGGRAL